MHHHHLIFFTVLSFLLQQSFSFITVLHAESMRCAPLDCAAEMCFGYPQIPGYTPPPSEGAPIASVKWLPRQRVCSSPIFGARRRREERSGHCERQRRSEGRTVRPFFESLKREEQIPHPSAWRTLNALLSRQHLDWNMVLSLDTINVYSYASRQSNFKAQQLLNKRQTQIQSRNWWSQWCLQRALVSFTMASF